MGIEKFEDIIAWQKAGAMSLAMYRQFGECRDYGFKNQIERATVSVMNNIAEGFERSSNKEFKYFLYVAKGSCGEVRSMLYLAFRLNYISEDEFKFFYGLSVGISRLLAGLIRTLA